MWTTVKWSIRGIQCRINPFTPKISLVIHLTVCHKIHVMLVREFGIGSPDNSLIYIFLYSHHLHTWYSQILWGKTPSWSVMGVNIFFGSWQWLCWWCCVINTHAVFIFRIEDRRLASDKTARTIQIRGGILKYILQTSQRGMLL